jgi:hypothetical protein
VIGVDNQLNRWGGPVPFRAEGRSYLMINSIGGAVAVVPLDDAVTVTATRPVGSGRLAPSEDLRMQRCRARSSLVLVVRRTFATYLLQLPQLAPTNVLLGLGRIWIFFAFEPEAEPVNVSLLGRNSIAWPVQNMRALGK